MAGAGNTGPATTPHFCNPPFPLPVFLPAVAAIRFPVYGN